MSYQVLARKYRPQRFTDVIGQDHVTRTLKNAIEQGRIAHGYIFSGHRGIGKTTVARILAMALNCRSADDPVPEPCGVCESCTEIRAGNSVDVIEIDAATNRGIDEIRELREAARYRPARDRFKVWILDEAHQITDAAFNALLKTLEEPPGHVVFMLATTQPEDIPQTIRSRCQHFSFHAVRFEEIVQQLRAIAKREDIGADENALAMLAEAGDGSMRDALSIMDQAIACCGQRLTDEVVRQLVGAVPSETLEQMLNAVAADSSEDVLRHVDRLLTEGHNPAHFARQMVRFLRNAVVAKVAGSDSPLLQISADERARVDRVAAQFSEEDLTRFLQVMLRTHGELGYKQEQRFHLELGLLKLVHAQRLLPLEQVLSDAAVSGSASPPGMPAAAAQNRPETRRGATETGAGRPSPFEADKARKASSTAAWDSRTPKAETGAATAVGMATEAPTGAVEGSPEAIRTAVLRALEQANSRAIVLGVEARGGELLIKFDVPENLLEMSISADTGKAVTQAAGRAAGRPLKLKLSGSNGAGGSRPAQAATAPEQSGPGARARAAEDPVVRRMQEKFGAQIRTVIDYRQKN